VTSEVEPVDEADQPALIIEGPGPELGEALRGGGHEPAAHRRLRRRRRGGLGRVADGLQGAPVAAARQARQHRGDHVVGQQVHRRERVVGLQAHLTIDAVVVGDGAYPGPAHRDPPAPEGHLAVLAAVPVRGTVGVVAALRAGHLGDLGLDELAHHVQADGHRRRQQALAHLGSEHFELLAHLAGQPLRQAGSAVWTNPISGTSRRLPADAVFVCDACLLFIGGPPVHSEGVATPSVPHGTIEAEDRH
jgi:hypothetical protein